MWVSGARDLVGLDPDPAGCRDCPWQEGMEEERVVMAYTRDIYWVADKSSRVAAGCKWDSEALAIVVLGSLHCRFPLHYHRTKAVLV